MKRLICLIISLVMLLSMLCIGVGAESQFPDTSHAKAVCLYNLNTNKSIYSKNTTEKIFPTGAVKMVTGLIACQMLENRLDEQITVTDDMLTGAVGANIKLKVGMTVTIKDLLYGVLCGGGNDAARVLASICADSTQAFVDLMNKKAKEWRLSQTHFTNPDGADDRNMYSSLSDIMVIARLASTNELYMEISSTPSYEFLPLGAQQKIKFFNRNALISTFYSADYKYQYASGIAVGNTDLGGHCVISFAEKNGTQYICAVMGADKDEDSIYSYKTAVEMFSFAFDNFAYTRIAEADKLYHSMPLSMVLPTNGKDSEVRCVLKDDIYALTDKNIDKDNALTYKYYFHEQPRKAPVSAGEVVGGVDVLYNGEIIGSGVLVTDSAVEASSALVMLENMRDFFIGRFFITFFIVLIVLLLLFFFVYERSSRHRSSKEKSYKPRKK